MTKNYLQDNLTFAIPKKKRERKRDEQDWKLRKKVGRSYVSRAREGSSNGTLYLYVLLQQEWCGNRSNQYRK